MFICSSARKMSLLKDNGSGHKRLWVLLISYHRGNWPRLVVTVSGWLSPYISLGWGCPGSRWGRYPPSGTGRARSSPRCGIPADTASPLGSHQPMRRLDTNHVTNQRACYIPAGTCLPHGSHQPMSRLDINQVTNQRACYIPAGTAWLHCSHPRDPPQSTCWWSSHSSPSEPGVNILYLFDLIFSWCLPHVELSWCFFWCKI